MAGKRRITNAERRHQDYLRRNGLKVSSVYETRLARLRRKELRRVLDLCVESGDEAQIPGIIESSIDESGYLLDWWQGLWSAAGVPMAKATAADLRQAKAAGEDDIWLKTLRRYATVRAGNNISIVSGTWKDSLVGLIRDIMQDDLTLGIEKLTKKIYNSYIGSLEKWQVRRIARTEAMIGMADAADLAAKTLDVAYTKQWCISGLGNTRPSHEDMDGVTVDQNEPFSLPGGLLMYPHDTSMGADAGEIINCACACIRRPKENSEAAAVNNPTIAPATAPAADTQIDERAKRIQELKDELPADMDDDTKQARAENMFEIEKKLDVKKGASMTIEEADMQNANPLYGTADQYGINCATCAPAYVLREWGFDITAKGRRETKLNNLIAYEKSFDIWKNPDGTKATPVKVGDWLKKKGYNMMTSTRYKQFLEENCKEQGTYILTLAWKKQLGGGGHATILKRLPDGSLVNIEPQVYDSVKGAKLDIVKELCANVSPNRGWQKGVMRVDDKIFDTSWLGLFNVK